MEAAIPRGEHPRGRIVRNEPMGAITPLHLLIVLVVALLVLGPGNLPEVGAALGKAMREFRKATSDAQEATSPSPTPSIPAATSAEPIGTVPAPAAATAPVPASTPTATESSTAPPAAPES